MNKENGHILFNKSFLFYELLETENLFYYIEKDPQPGDSVDYLVTYKIPVSSNLVTKVSVFHNI